MDRTVILIVLGVVAAFFLLILLGLGTTHKSPPSEESSLVMTSKAAAIPSSARGPAIDPKKGYFVEEIRDGLYWVTDGVYQVIFLTTGEGVIAVDAPPSLGQNYLKAIAEVTTEPVTHLIYSHSHADHIGAASMFPNNVTIIAHEDTKAKLVRDNDPRRPIPTVTFSDNYTLTVGNQTLELSYKGPSHEPGNIFIYAPHQKVLMLVDVIFPGWTPFMFLALAEDVPAYIQAHDQVLEFDFDTFIGGHLGRLGTRQDVSIQREYILDMKANATDALKTIDFAAIGKKVGFDNPWLLFDVYLKAVAQKCADVTLAKWRGRLAGADVFTFSHCFRLMNSLRLD